MLQSGISLNMPTCGGDVDILQVPDFVNVSDQGPGKTSPESGDILAMLDLVSNLDPGPGEPLLESGVGLDMPHFAIDCDILQVQDIVSAIDPGRGRSARGDLPGVRGYISSAGCLQ